MVSSKFNIDTNSFRDRRRHDRFFPDAFFSFISLSVSFLTEIGQPQFKVSIFSSFSYFAFESPLPFTPVY